MPHKTASFNAMDSAIAISVKEGMGDSIYVRATNDGNKVVVFSSFGETINLSFYISTKQ